MKSFIFFVSIATAAASIDAFDPRVEDITSSISRHFTDPAGGGMPLPEISQIEDIMSSISRQFTESLFPLLSLERTGKPEEVYVRFTEPTYSYESDIDIPIPPSQTIQLKTQPQYSEIMEKMKTLKARVTILENNSFLSSVFLMGIVLSMCMISCGRKRYSKQKKEIHAVIPKLEEPLKIVTVPNAMISA